MTRTSVFSVAGAPSLDPLAERRIRRHALPDRVIHAAVDGRAFGRRTSLPPQMLEPGEFVRKKRWERGPRRRSGPDRNRQDCLRALDWDDRESHGVYLRTRTRQRRGPRRSNMTLRIAAAVVPTCLYTARSRKAGPHPHATTARAAAGGGCRRGFIRRASCRDVTWRCCDARVRWIALIALSVTPNSIATARSDCPVRASCDGLPPPPRSPSDR